MILLSGKPFQQSDMWPSTNMEDIILEEMQGDHIIYSFSSFDQLMFALQLRKQIILSAEAMNQSEMEFAVFATSRCNPEYWRLTELGGFQLRRGVKPSAAIQDFYKNSSLYAFECAGAMLIIYYHAVLNTIGEDAFNYLFPDLYIYSWHSDSDLGIHSIYTHDFLPGDVVYFKNPDFDPNASQWRGENAVVMGDGTYFGHGLGRRTAEEMIEALNKNRKQGSNQSAYLMSAAKRLSFKHLAEFSVPQRNHPKQKYKYPIVPHNRTSIQFEDYLIFLYSMYRTP
ncbi:protein-glutamine gamma-glutamyltransferase [Halobacillus hunanensis]|uniref:protein-glutamine gamma-glutamyltransferase n=1 Tax=Halobacillus hunanensis TaxID=578214 RepID=UPI0009A82488|nr:protein-glutamine gamma-glutamyltransferase [Halobacillus hunanensis]